MNEILLQFAKSTTIGGRLIEWYDHGQYAHVDVVLPGGNLLGARNDAYGNIPAGVEVRPPDYLGETPTMLVALPTTAVISDKFYEFVTQQLGKPYDTSAIAGFVAGREWDNPAAWFCSELAAAGLVESGYLHPLSAPCNKIAPDDLLLICSALVPLF